MYKSKKVLLLGSGELGKEVTIESEYNQYTILGLEQALAIPNTQVRIFGKPVTTKGRRIAVALSTSDTVEKAREKAKQAIDRLTDKSI